MEAQLALSPPGQRQLAPLLPATHLSSVKWDGMMASHPDRLPMTWHSLPSALTRLLLKYALKSSSIRSTFGNSYTLFQFATLTGSHFLLWTKTSPASCCRVPGSVLQASQTCSKSRVNFPQPSVPNPCVTCSEPQDFQRLLPLQKNPVS